MKKLDLRVLVTQENQEALARIASLTRLIWILAMSAVTLVTLAGAHFTLHRRMLYEDVSEALKSPVRPPTIRARLGSGHRGRINGAN